MPVSQPTLLLVTSDPQLQYLITRYGEQGGCQVRSVDTVEGAMLLMREERPASVLLHLLSGPNQSWEMFRRLKASPAAEGIPLTVISALADEARARDEGAAYWLWQPVMYVDFLAALAATKVLEPCG
jgi:DNA-binding response OmpR family regulator